MNILPILLILWRCTNSNPTALSTDLHPCSMTWNVTLDGYSVDCSNHHLKDVPKDLPRDSVILDLLGNDLGTLKDYSFIHLPRLIKLNLAACRLDVIGPKAFEGLYHLESLRLDHNNLRLDNFTYHKDVFQPLGQLTDLDLRFNDNRLSGTTPNEIFVNMGNLEHLALDTFKEEIFGPGFNNLTRLKKLTLSPLQNYMYYCGILRLKNDTFLVFENSSIMFLDLSYCPLYGIEPGTFMPLLHISKINMDTVSNLPTSTVLRGIYGLSGKNVSLLILQHCYYPKGATIEDVKKQIIDETTIASLSDMCIEHLAMPNNRIIYIDKSFVSKFSKCIKYLDLSHNYITGDFMILPYMHLMKFLEYFDMSFQLTAASFSDGNYVLEKEQFVAENLSTTSLPGTQTCIADANVPLPPSLKVLKVRSITRNVGFFSVSNFFGAKHLTIMDLADNGARGMKDHITGLEHVEKVDFSKNNGSGMTDAFLTSFTGVSDLSLSYMGFDENALTPGGPVYLGLRSLRNVTSLDLTGNNIRFLSDDFFQPLQRLIQLHVSNNGFVSLPADLTFVPKLALLDLSLNSIIYLHDNEIDELEMFGIRNKLVLKLSGNPILCSCHSLAFIKWLTTTSVSLDKGGNYSCVTEDGVLTSTAAFNRYYNYHWTSCQARFWLPFAITLMCLFALSIVSAMFMDRNWTRIQHQIMVFLGRGVKRMTRDLFQKDAYIAHCDHLPDFRFVNGDLRLVLEETFNLRLILPYRDHLGNHFVADNIVDSVNNSWKTLFVVTDEFLKDPLSFFTMKAAAYAVSDANPNRVILLLLGNVNHGRIPEALLNVTDEDDIFELDGIPAVHDDVWKIVRDRILKESS